MNLPTLSVPLSPDEILCCGCLQPMQRAFAQTGKVNKGISFAQIIVPELSFDPVKDQIVIEEIDKTFPISQWAKGFVCSTCASDYRTVKHTRKDGSIWYEPIVQLDPSPTLTQTLNTGEGSSEERKKDESEGFAPLEAWLHTPLVPKEEPLHYSSYKRFMMGGGITPRVCGRCGKHRDRHSVGGKCPSNGRTRTIYKSDAQLNAEAK